MCKIASAILAVDDQLTFLVPEKEGLLCRVGPLEGGVVIILHTAGHVCCPTLRHRDILNQRVLTAAACDTTHKRKRSEKTSSVTRGEEEEKDAEVDVVRQMVDFFLLACLC